ncbi:GGDEF domain-containing protein [Halopseudomonas bauzanensis]|uniref:GGDEF domain-containing protein n=1 Tax=Halopseudomonas bauzanensis TaxID=653930 RepID=UPI003526A80A
MISVFTLFSEALLEFHQQRMSRLWLWWPVAVVGPLSLLEAETLRILVVALLSCYQAALLLVILGRNRAQTAGRGQYFVMVGAVMGLAIMCYRAVGASLGLGQLQITSSTPLQMATFLVSSIVMILTSMGLVLMTKERTDARNRMLALHDELTGLPNRRYSLEVLTRWLAGMERGRQPLSLMMLDIDHFKRINDTHGHLTGDRSLQQLAEILRARLRTQDHVGRLGGEEFLVILPNTTASGAHELAETLRRSVEQMASDSDDSSAPNMTISIGVCTLEADTRLNPEEAIDRADAALYQAKQKGRNRIETAEVRVVTTPAAAPHESPRVPPAAAGSAPAP